MFGNATEISNKMSLNNGVSNYTEKQTQMKFADANVAILFAFAVVCVRRDDQMFYNFQLQTTKRAMPLRLKSAGTSLKKHIE